MLLRRVKPSHEEAFDSKREAFFQGKTHTSCLLYSSEKNGKKGLTVCDFPDNARSTQQNHPLLRTHVRDQANSAVIVVQSTQDREGEDLAIS